MRRRTALVVHRDTRGEPFQTAISCHATWRRARQCLKRLAEREGVNPADVDTELTIDEMIPHPTIPGAVTSDTRVFAYIAQW